MAKAERRYDEFPALANMLRALSPGGRALVREWHRVLLAGYDAFVQAYPSEYARGGVTGDALRQWSRVMRSVEELIVDCRPAAWCCKHGALAWPDACPAHVLPLPGASRMVGDTAEVCTLAGEWVKLASVPSVGVGSDVGSVTNGKGK